MKRRPQVLVEILWCIFLGGLLPAAAAGTSGNALTGTWTGSTDLEVQLLEPPAISGQDDEKERAWRSLVREVYGAPRGESVKSLLAQARWDFDPDGTFRLTPRLAIDPSGFFPLVGRYQPAAEGFEIHGTGKAPLGPSYTLDGRMQQVGSRYRLEAVVTRTHLSLDRWLARVDQLLEEGELPDPPASAERPNAKISAPADFHISIRGRSRGVELPEVNGLLSFRAPNTDGGAPDVLLGAMSLTEPGTVHWPMLPAGYESSRVFVSDGAMTIEAEAGQSWAPDWVGSLGLQHFDFPAFNLASRGRLEIRMSGDQIEGEIHLESFEKGDEGYRATFQGSRRKPESAKFPENLLSESLKKFYIFESGPGDLQGRWKLEDGAGVSLGSLLLETKAEGTLHGLWTRADQTTEVGVGPWRDSLVELVEEGGARWAMRALEGGELLVAVRTETTGKPSLIGVGARLDQTPQYTLEKKYWPDLVDRVALGVQASKTGRCIQARLPFEDVLVELRRYQEGAGRQRPEGMAAVLGFTQTITSHLTQCDLQVGDPEALLRHLRAAANTLRPLQQAQREVIVEHGKPLGGLTPLLEMLDAQGTDLAELAQTLDRRETSPAFVQAVEVGSTGSEEAYLALSEGLVALRFLQEEILAARLPPDEGTKALQGVARETWQRLEEIFTRLSLAGKEIAERSPEFIASRDALWQEMSQICDLDLIQVSSLAFALQRSLEQSQALSDDEKRFLAAQAVSGMSLVGVTMALKLYEEKISAWSIMTRTLLRAVDAAAVLAVSPEGWRGQLVTDSEKKEALDRLEPFFEELILFLVDEGQASDALVVSEIARSRAFVDLLQSRETIQKGLGELSRRGGDGSFPSPVAATPPTLAEILATVRDRKSTTVEHLLAKDRLVIWMITPDGKVSAVSTPIDRSALRATIDDLHSWLEGDSSYSQGRAALRELYALLIQPIPPDRRPSSPEEPLTLVPHRELFGVPFAALEDEEGRRLIEHHPLVYGTSIAALGAMRRNRESRPAEKSDLRLLALVNPKPLPQNVGGGNLPPLPRLERGFSSIAAFYLEKGRHVLTGREATKEALFAHAAEADVVQLATHAGFSETDPLFSFIALAGKDGALRVPEVFRLRLNTDLVILWACETGRGRVTADGVEGLSRGFTWAGASSLILSLWQIPEEESGIQMYGFHEFWLRQGLSKARALQQAQVDHSRLYPEQPGLWAGFVLYGEAE